MNRNITYIPTLEDYAKYRREAMTLDVEPMCCEECDYLRENVNACIWGGMVRNLDLLRACPISCRRICR